MTNTFPVCPKHATSMVPHTPYPKHVSYKEGYIRFRCPNLSCSIVYVEGPSRGLYVLDSNGRLKLYNSEGHG